MLAAELALARVDVAVVERRKAQELESARGRGLSARTLEVLDQRGVVERFLAEGQKMQVASFSVPLDISEQPTRHAYGLALLQAHVERLLAAWVAELGVPTYREREVTGFTQDDAGVDVALSNGESLRATYLVGCDGGRSLVRKTAGIDFPGWDPSVSFMIAEVEMTEEPPFGMRRDAKGTYALGRHEDGKRVGVVLREEEVRQGEAPTLEELREALVALYGSDFGLRSATWISRFTDMTRQAARYRDRRVLLAGDAAHVHSPVGGQGLNLGVQDAVNLGWKLAQVVRGTSSDSLLDSYHAERHPVGARVLEGTMAQTALSRGDARMDAVRDHVAELLRMEEPRRRFGARMSGLDIHYDLGAGHPLLGRRVPDLDLVTERGEERIFSLLREARPLLLDLGQRTEQGAGGAGEATAAASVALDLGPWSDRVRRVVARCDGLWELPVVGVVPAPTGLLVRPDGHVAWVGEGGGDGGLREALGAWFGPAQSSRRDAP